MKITGVEVEVREVPVKHVFRWRAGLPGSGTTQVESRVEIQTDEGVTGVAYGARGAIIVDLFDRRLREMLVGRDPLLKEELWERSGRSTGSRSCRSMSSAWPTLPCGT